MAAADLSVDVLRGARRRCLGVLKQRSRCNVPKFEIVVTSQMLCNQRMNQVSLLGNPGSFERPNDFQRRAYTPGAQISLEWLFGLCTF